MREFKRGFTMVELIFVIVILGILAAVALPRLSATRDDAEITSYAKNLSILLSDISGYFMSQDGYQENISHMTDVPLINISKFKAELPLRGIGCLEIVVYNYDGKDVTRGSAEVLPINQSNVACKKVQASPIIDNYIKQGKYILIGKPPSH